MLPLLLAAALAAAPAPAVGGARAAEPALAAAPAGADPYDDDEPSEEEPTPRLILTAWGGEGFGTGGRGLSAPLAGGEVAWAFDQVDVGVAAYGYHGLLATAPGWSPVALLRLTERFEVRRGVDAAFTFGAGAGHPGHWVVWFQVALGLRVDLGPVFLAAETAFEQYDLVRVAGGIGLKI